MYCVCTYIVSVVRCQMYVVHSCQTCCKEDGIKTLNNAFCTHLWNFVKLYRMLTKDERQSRIPGEVY